LLEKRILFNKIFIPFEIKSPPARLVPADFLFGHNPGGIRFHGAKRTKWTKWTKWTLFQHSNSPTLQFSNTPILHYSITPLLQYSIARARKRGLPQVDSFQKFQFTFVVRFGYSFNKKSCFIFRDDLRRRNFFCFGIFAGRI